MIQPAAQTWYWFFAKALAITAVFAVLAGLVTPAEAARRVALVIGNDLYRNLGPDEQLKAAVNDARIVKRSLESIGFEEVLFGENLDRNGFEDKLLEFRQKIAPGDTAFFFYAGHGVELKTGNYMLPVDISAPPANDSAAELRVSTKSISEDDITRQIVESGAVVSVLVFDACRNNPLKSPDGRSAFATRGLKPMENPPRGVFKIYSAGQGQVAADRLPGDPDNANSLFTRVFVKHLATPGLSLQELATKTANEVIEVARQNKLEQTPDYSDKVLTAVYLAGAPEQPSATGGPAQIPPPPAEKTENFEKEYWVSIMDSDNPDFFKSYLRKYPNGQFVEIARQKIESIERLDEIKKKIDQDREREERFWQSVEHTDDPQKIIDYMRQFPNGRYIDVAKFLLEKLTAEQKVRTELEDTIWNQASGSRNRLLLEQYLTRYPNGKFTADARREIAQIDAGEKSARLEVERQAWMSVRASEDTAALQNFVNAYPYGEYAQIARDKIAVILEKQRLDALKQQQEAPPVAASTAPDDQALVSDRCRTGLLSSLAAGEQAVRLVMFYYEDLNSRDSDCAISRWSSMSPKRRSMIENWGESRIHQIGLRYMSSDQSYAEVGVNVTVRARSGPWESYNVVAQLERRGGAWVITKMGNAK